MPEEGDKFTQVTLHVRSTAQPHAATKDASLQHAANAQPVPIF
jgi:hypothetical protein